MIVVSEAQDVNRDLILEVKNVAGNLSPRGSGSSSKVSKQTMDHILAYCNLDTTYQVENLQHPDDNSIVPK